MDVYLVCNNNRRGACKQMRHQTRQHAPVDGRSGPHPAFAISDRQVRFIKSTEALPLLWAPSRRRLLLTSCLLTLLPAGPVPPASSSRGSMPGKYCAAIMQL